jgi:hypothetical protein
MTYLFTKDGCGKCDWVKANVDLDRLSEVQVLTLDKDDPEPLAMLAYFECVSLSEKKLPILVSENGDIITGAISIRDHLQGRLP